MEIRRFEKDREPRMEKNSHQIALDSEVLHATKCKLPLYYNGDYDLGKYLESPQQQGSKEHFTLSKMNVTTKNITPPDLGAKPKRGFLFIK